MKEIILSKGLNALVDDADYALVNQFKWSASESQGNGRTAKFYAARLERQTPGKYKKKYLHRFVLGDYQGPLVVDHINGNSLDCRKENLRLVTKKENAWNRDYRGRGRGCEAFDIC